MTISDPSQLIALAKVLNYVKFKCEDYECRYLAGSPVVGELYKAASESLHAYYKEKGIKYLEEWGFIESLPHYITTIEIHIKNTDNWKELGNDTKVELIACLVHPYKVRQDTIEYLLKVGSQYHQ